MNNDISNLQQQKNGGLFHTRNTKEVNKEVYEGRKTLWGYTGATTDKEVAQGQYVVFVNELNGAPILARRLYAPEDIRPNGAGGSPNKLELHQPVLLMPLNETGEYGIISSYIPLTSDLRKDISSFIEASGGDPLAIKEKLNDSKYKSSSLLRQNFISGWENEIKASGLTIKPFDFNEVNYSWSELGNLYFDSYNGDTYEQILNKKVSNSSNVSQLIDGTSKTKIDKSKSELFKFYHHTKYKLANSTKRLYEYQNGKIIPGPLLSQIRTFSGNFDGLGEDVVNIIDRLTSFLNQADNIITAISDYIEWFDGNILAQVTDLISIIGLPTGLTLGSVINIGLDYNGDNPIGVTVDLNLGNRYVEAFLEGVANSLISDFIGESSLNNLIEGGLTAIGIDIAGKDKPDETQSINSLGPKLPTKRNSKSLIDIIESVGNIIPGSFGEYLQSFKNVTESIGLTDNGVIQLNNPNGDYYNYLDYSKLNLDLGTPDGRLSSYISTLGYEYGAFTVKAIKNFQLTQNPIYCLLSIIPLVPLDVKIWISLFIFYVTKSENSFIYLVKEYIEPNINPWSNNLYITQLVNLKHNDIFNTLEELNYNNLDFNNLILNPISELQKIELDNQLYYYFMELLDGKILNFLRGCLLITSGYDITLDLELYSKMNLLIKEIYYA